MKETIFTVRTIASPAPGVFELVLDGDASQIEHPGQFAEISVPGHFLRRPISVCDWTPNSLTLLVRAVGDGTRWLGLATPGMRLEVLLPLGNGFNPEAAPKDAPAILAGGGIGIAPLFALAKSLIARGVRCIATLGFKNGGDVFFADRFEALGCSIALATEDGSAGTKGFVTDAISGLVASAPHPGAHAPYLFACGPLPMMKALAAMPLFSGSQFSLESRMGCGFGACMGCTIQTAAGPARICKEGPVFTKEALAW